MISNAKVYILDDCDDILYILANWLSQDLDVSLYSTPEALIEDFKNSPPHLCILDIHLTENKTMTEGLDILSQLQNHLAEIDAHVPFIVITKKNSLELKERALELGAIDFLSKPLIKNEVVLKVKNILSVSTVVPKASEISNEKIQIFNDNLEVKIRNSENESLKLTLTPKEFLIFKQLHKHMYATVSREQIVICFENEFRGEAPTDRAIDVHVCNIKKKLGKLKSPIKTVYGIGYRLDMQKM